jgi:hypothetical protein
MSGFLHLFMILLLLMENHVGGALKRKKTSVKLAFIYDSCNRRQDAS